MGKVSTRLGRMVQRCKPHEFLRLAYKSLQLYPVEQHWKPRSSTCRLRLLQIRNLRHHLNWSYQCSDNPARTQRFKRIGFAKLVGQSTGGGCAAYIGSPPLRLPASGMIFRVETEIVINPDGSINELFGTPPDIELPEADPPGSITKEELLKDEWIRTVIDDL